MRTYTQRDCPVESILEILANRTPNHKTTEPRTFRNTSNFGIHPKSSSRMSFDPSILHTLDVEFTGGGVSGAGRCSGGDSGRGTIGGGGESEGSG